nr:hypothetical protein OG499_37980 [Streptomyces anulatus]
MDSAAVDQFEAGRGRLASLAYRLLGSAADAEDAPPSAAAAARPTRRPRAGSSRSFSPPPRRGAPTGWWRCSPTT